VLANAGCPVYYYYYYYYYYYCCYYYYYNICLMAFFSRTTWVSRHQKGKPFWILLEQQMMGWQWHQLDHMQIICTSLQTDNHASTFVSDIAIFVLKRDVKLQLTN